MAKDYLYNGVQLPALPVYDSETYPYLVIVNGISTCYLYASQNPCVANFDQGLGIVSGITVPGPRLTFKINNDVWSDPEYDESYKAPLSSVVKWSNHDILQDNDGSVWLAASDPVPVGGEPTLTERDLYRKINGQPTKLTLYKKVGGELVALDEYSSVSATAVQSNT